MPKMVKVHVTFNDSKRILSLQKGEEVKHLRHLFMQDFSDVLLNQVAPADVKLQRHDSSFDDYVDLTGDEKLEDDIKVRALVSKQEKQTVTPSAGEGETSSKHPHCGPHWVFPWILLYGTGHTQMVVPMFPACETEGPIVYHPVNPDTSYRFWSPVSRENGSLLHRNSSNNQVDCKGSFSGGSNAEITTSAISNDYVSLLFKDGNKIYVITAEGQNGENITAVESSSGYPYPDNATFVAHHFWSYTVFQNKQFNTKYLGTDYSGSTSLVDMGSRQYPNPQALFILNTV